ncbi:hypothetical protein XaFJ1_GM000266 [Xanthomonas albilineans]|nr:hypothetical protein XaFJ1_GM000266 [Xanthomonas albilineans]
MVTTSALSKRDLMVARGQPQAEQHLAKEQVEGQAHCVLKQLRQPAVRS